MNALKPFQNGAQRQAPRSRAQCAKLAPRRELDLTRTNANPIAQFLNPLTVAMANNKAINDWKIENAIKGAGDYNVEEVKGKLDKLISENPVIMFSSSKSAFCNDAKEVLDNASANYMTIEMNEVEDGKQLKAELAKMTNRTNVPNIFIGGKSIGGCYDGPGVATLAEEGKLAAMLKEAGATKA